MVANHIVSVIGIKEIKVIIIIAIIYLRIRLSNNKWMSLITIHYLSLVDNSKTAAMRQLR